MPSTPIAVSPTSASVPPSKKIPPVSSSTKLHFQYAPSPNGKDRNLLILLHGLGDTEAPFFTLGKQVNLPNTAVLAIRAPLQIPLLEEPAFMWYQSFTVPDFMPVTSPNPAEILKTLTAFLAHLITLGWAYNDIHLFGFAQGGSVALQLALALSASTRLGSVTSCSGPLLSLPTLAQNQTPCLVLHRPSSPLSKADLAALHKGFRDVREVLFKSGDGMPRGAPEWEPVMKFWSEVLGREETSMGGGGEMYEVLSGGPKMGQ